MTKKWLAWAVAILGTALLMVLVTAYQNKRQDAARADAAQKARVLAAPPPCEIDIYVPSDLKGDYWLYLNGEIVSAPPHRIEPGGLGLELYPGKYTVELWAVDADRSFPFSMTVRNIVNLALNDDRRILVGGPDNWWSPHPDAAQAARETFDECKLGGQVRYSEWDMQGFVSDPLVRALTALNLTVLPEKFKAVLDLPLEQGGVREFDGTQIRYIARAILKRYGDKPSHEDVYSCKQRHPEFAQAYDAFDGLLSDYQEKLQLFHTMAAN